jgi:outer membrane protein assembly factor BamB
MIAGIMLATARARQRRFGLEPWQRDFGGQLRMRMAFGEGMGPVLVDDKLILVFDHEGGDSFVAAVDKTTGKDVWRVARDERSNWAAPLVVDVKGTKQVIVAATKAVRAYDLRDGETFEVLATNAMKDETFIATPAIAGGEIYLRSQKRLYCIASR